MKFDTKKTAAATKISSSTVSFCYLVPNPAIPVRAYEETRDAESDGKTSGDDDINMGRQVMYQPTLLLSPVYASKRLANLQGKPSGGAENPSAGAPAKRSLLSWSGVENL
jgi:hypothetical protein